MSVHTSFSWKSVEKSVPTTNKKMTNVTFLSLKLFSVIEFYLYCTRCWDI